MNKEFQELKTRYLQATGEDKDLLLNQMRENLKCRNENASLYTNQYTHKGETIDIEICNDQKLFEIEGDMVVQDK